MMRNDQYWTVRECWGFVGGLLFALTLYGALPFLLTPTLGQAVWSSGFAQSFANGSLWSPYAHDFGLPRPAPISFGLAAMWPASWFIRLRFHPADAYAAISALWLIVAYVCAHRIARLFGASRTLSTLGAIAWLSMPIVWAHAGYSMLSLGIALLPYYFLTALRLSWVAPHGGAIDRRLAIHYLAAALVSVFMDGYTFVMFAAGASLLLGAAVLGRPASRALLLKRALPIHAAAFAIAYVLYSMYIGKSSYEVQSIDFFRGWGLDLRFLAQPTFGVHWLADLLGLSSRRSDLAYFGDASVWTTTFGLPLLLASIAAFVSVRKHNRIALVAIAIAAFGFYMALGPSLKINATKPAAMQASQPGQLSALMPAALALAPTGNAWISQKVPGFDVMRASYRWSALGMFGCWMLVMLGAALTRHDRRWALALLGIVALNLPDLPSRWRDAHDNRLMFRQIDAELVAALQQHVKPQEKVAIVPWGNDFMANYVAARTPFRTYNVGGDKNLMMAQAQWPAALLALNDADPAKARTAATLLTSGAADVLLIPYVHMLWSPHLWPCADETTARPNAADFLRYRTTPGFVCPAARRTQLAPFLAALQATGMVDVTDTRLFAVVRLRPGASHTFAQLRFPLVMGNTNPDTALVLTQGWHEAEHDHVWSEAQAVLTLPAACSGGACRILLTYAPFGASPQRKVTVHFHTVGPAGPYDEDVEATSSDPHVISLPSSGALAAQSIAISVSPAVSPAALAGANDNRVLGISLSKIDVKPGQK